MMGQPWAQGAHQPWEVHYQCRVVLSSCEMPLGVFQISRVESFRYEFDLCLLIVTALSEVPTMKKWGRDLDMQLTDLRFGQGSPSISVHNI
jgi:hypothetical protein